MANRRQRALALLTAALLALLPGCAAVGGSVEGLLRAPRLSGETSAVQRALAAHEEGNVTFKYPASGEFLTPVLFGDWDGDGQQEAAVLYTTDTATNAFVAILEPEGEGGWRVVQTAEGLSGEVSSVQTAHLRDADSLQMLVGYGSPQGDSYLVVYLYSDGALQTVISRSYSEMLLTSITGKADTQDLVLALPSQGENAGIDLELLTNTEEGFRSAQTLAVGEGQLTACAALSAGVGADGLPYLVVDGWSGTSATSLVSNFVSYNSETGFLNTALPEALSDPYTVTLRYDTQLTSRDIDGNGTIDIPIESAGDGTLAEPLDRSLRLLTWRDFQGGAGQQLFGVYDSENRFFLTLPRWLRGNVEIQPNAAGTGWLVSNQRSNTLYFELRVVDPAERPAGEEYHRIANIGSFQLQARVYNERSGLRLEDIEANTLLLQG